MKTKPGDKVRVKSGSHAGERGIVEASDGGRFLVRLEASGRSVRLMPEAITNFSLAARKAWVTGPDRAVGRRKGTRLCDRVSVTLRINRDLWERFREMERLGLIEDRTAAINKWLGQKLDELRGGRLSPL